MKKIAIYTLGTAFFVLGISACAKSTKGKMINDWKVVSSEENYVLTQSSNSYKQTRTTAMTESLVTIKETFESTTGSTSNQVTYDIKTNEMTIRQDGTWSSVYEITDESDGKTEQIGTWSFIGKVKEDGLKKNERVLFNVLKNSHTTGSYVESNTYLTGEKVMIYRITESKKDVLEIESEENFISNATWGSQSVKTTKKMSLKKK